MIRDTGGATYNNTITDRGATGNASTTANEAVFADRDVMTDLHLIIDFGAFANARGGNGAAIYGSVGAHFNIITENNRTQRSNTHNFLIDRRHNTGLFGRFNATL